MSATEELLTELLDERERIIDKKAARIAELENKVDALESDARLTESLQVRPLREHIAELEAAAKLVVRRRDVGKLLEAIDALAKVLKGGS